MTPLTQSLVGNSILILSFQFGQVKSGAKIKIFMRIKKEIAYNGAYVCRNLIGSIMQCSMEGI
jgi:hypothetical protein